MSDKSKRASSLSVSISRQRCERIYAEWQAHPPGVPLGASLSQKLYRYRLACNAHPDWNLPEISAEASKVLQGGRFQKRTSSASAAPVELKDAVKEAAKLARQAEELAKAERKAAEKAEKKAIKDQSSVLKMEAERYKVFGKIFGNSGKFRIMDSVIKALKGQGFAFSSEQDVHDHASAYREFRLKNPQFNLPPLAFRQEGPTPLQEYYSLMRVRPDLAPFEFDYSLLNSLDGMVISGAQFDCHMRDDLWRTIKEQWIPFRKKMEGRRYGLGVLPIVFGPVDLTYSSALDDFELRGTFSEGLKNHMVLRDAWFGKALLKVMRIMPSMEGSFLTENVLDHLQNEPTRLTMVAAPVMELKHRPQPGLELGDQYPRAFATTGTLTIPDYGRDNLGLASRRATLSQMSTTFGFWVVDLVDGEPFAREIQDVNQDGCFIDFVKVNGKLKAFRFTPQGVKEVVGALDTTSAPDWHTGYGEAAVMEAYIGENGIIPTLKPHNVAMHDFIDASSVTPFLKRDKLYRLFQNANTYKLLRENYLFPAELDDYAKKLGIWKKNLDHAESEMMLGGLSLLNIGQRCPGTNIVYIPSNHNDWLDEMVMDGSAWSDKNHFFLCRLNGLLEDELKVATKEHADMAIATMGMGRIYLEAFVKREGPAFGVDPDQFMFRNRLQTFIRPTNGLIQVDFGRHGDKPMFRGKNKIPASAGMRVSIGHFHTGEIGRHLRGNGVMGRRRHYMREPTTNWTYSCNLMFKTGQQMMLHPRADGRWWAY